MDPSPAPPSPTAPAVAGNRMRSSSEGGQRWWNPNVNVTADGHHAAPNTSRFADFAVVPAYMQSEEMVASLHVRGNSLETVLEHAGLGHNKTSSLRLSQFKTTKFVYPHGVKDVYPAGVPCVLVELARAFVENGGLKAGAALWKLEFRDPEEIAESDAFRALVKESAPSPEASLEDIADLLVGFFAVLDGRDHPFGDFSDMELQFMARFLHKSNDRQLDDCYFRVTSHLQEPKKSLFCWLVDFLSAVSVSSAVATTRVAQVFGAVLAVRSPDAPVLSVRSTTRVRDAQVVLRACLSYAQRSRRTSALFVGIPLNRGDRGFDMAKFV